MNTININIKSQTVSRSLLSFSILVSFITYVIDPNSTNVFLSRLTIPAILGLIVLIFFFIAYSKYIIFNGYKIVLLFYGPFCFVLCLSLSIFLSLNKYNSLKEILILIFLILYSIVVYFVFKKSLIKQLIPLLILTSFITSFIGLYDLMAKNLGWFTFFNVSNSQAQSGFRYFGQAGQYAQIMLMIMIPIKYSSLYSKLSYFFKKILVFTIIMCVVFLLATGKISAIIGFIVGAFLFVIINIKVLYKDILLGLAFFLGLFFVVKIVTPKVIDMLVYRIESRITNREVGTPEADFVVTNFKNSIKAFEDNPITGAGLGAYQGVYADTEIHGTYLKMLGETGLVGVFGYLVFMGSIMYMLYKATKVKNNAYADFLIKMIPFFIGFLVCQAYCYHLRKLEFWILYAVLFIAYSNFSAQKVLLFMEEKENR